MKRNMFLFVMVVCVAVTFSVNVNAAPTNVVKIPITGFGYAKGHGVIPVGVADDGSFITVWVNAKTGSVDGSCFGRDRVPLGEPFTLVPSNSPESWEPAYPRRRGESPVLAMNGSGAFILVWNSAEGIKARKYDGCNASGAIGDHPVVGVSRNKGITISASINDSDLSFVAWEEFFDTGDHSGFEWYKTTGVSIRKVDSNGALSGDAVAVTAKSEGYTYFNTGGALPDIAMASNRFFVAWHERSGQNHAIRVQSYDVEGNAVGSAIEIAQYDSKTHVSNNLIAANNIGEFSVATKVDGDFGKKNKRYTFNSWLKIYRFDVGGALVWQAESPKYNGSKTILSLRSLMVGKEGSDTLLWATDTKNVNKAKLWNGRVNGEGWLEAPAPVKLFKPALLTYDASVAFNSKGEYLISYASNARYPSKLWGWLGSIFLN